MTRARLSMGMIGLLLLLSSCSKQDNGPVAPPPARDLTKTESEILTANNTFGLKLFRTVNASEGSSDVFLSPFSVAMALGMTLNGANGETKDAMQRTLEFHGLTDAEINQSYRSLMELLAGLDPKVTVQIANSIWSRMGFPVEAEFTATNKTYFNAETATLDFDSPDAVKTINDWVSSATHGKIPTILDEQIARDVVMYLINAIYFKGTWTTEFNPKSTHPDQFTTPSGAKQVSMMARKGTMQYFSDSRMEAVDLPYGNGRYSLTVLLPQDGHSVEELVTATDDAAWKGWMERFSPKVITLGLPKFTLEYKTQLKDALSAMGMSIAFEAGSADFTRINRDGGLFISRVIHKTFVDVNEEGTEAAAVTSVEVGRTSVDPTEVRMWVNRPFILAIREHHTGSILFIGKVVDP